MQEFHKLTFFNVIATGGRHKILDKAFKIPNMKNLCSSLMSNLETFLRFFFNFKFTNKEFQISEVIVNVMHSLVIKINLHLIE